MIFENGCSELVQKLIDKIGASQIFLSNKVTEILQSNDFVTIKTDLGNEFICSVAIVAIPWQNVQKINFFPPIPRQLKTQTIGTKKMVTSFIVEYFEAHWRIKGFSGNILSHNPHVICYEVKPKIIAGSIYHEEFYESILKPITLKILSNNFGEEMNHPIKWEQKTWEQSIHLNLPPINKINRVIWASTNSATSFRGFLNGAVQSGLRSSIQALLLIRPQTIDWTDMENIQHASVVRKKIGYFKRLLASFNIYNILTYFLIIGGYYVCRNHILK